MTDLGADVELRLLSDEHSTSTGHYTPDIRKFPDTRYHGAEPEGQLEDHYHNKRDDLSIPWRSISLDILALLLAALCLTSLVIIFAKYQDKPVPDWADSSDDISLNTIISIMSVVFEASLLEPTARAVSQTCWIWFSKRQRPLQDLEYFDAASRGPFASARLLWRLRSVHLGSLGALIFVAALALDPFFQQTVYYENREVLNQTTVAQTSAAHVWGAGLTSRGDAGSSALPYGIKTAMYNGLLASSDSFLPDPPYSCPGGDCTWDSFGTLAINVQCQDVTSSVAVRCNGTGLNATYSGSSCAFQAIHDPLMADMFRPTTAMDRYNALVMKSYLPSQVSTLGPYLKPWANYTGLFAVVQWVKRLDAFTGSTRALTASTPYEAARCFFYVAVNQISANSNDGYYEEQLLQEYVQAENTPSPVLSSNSTSGLNSSVQAPALIFNPPFARTNQSQNTNNTFTIPYAALNMLASQMTGETKASNGFLNGKVSLSADGTVSGPDIPSLLSQAPNMTQAMFNLALYMSNEIRVNSTRTLRQVSNNNTLFDPDETIPGEVWSNVPFVVVRWAWLSLPIALLGLNVVFVNAVYVTAWRKRVSGWETSPLALFFRAQRIKEAKEMWQDPDSCDVGEKAASGYTACIPKSNRGIIQVYPSVGALVRRDKGQFLDDWF